MVLRKESLAPEGIPIFLVALLASASIEPQPREIRLALHVRGESREVDRYVAASSDQGGRHAARPIRLPARALSRRPGTEHLALGPVTRFVLSREPALTFTLLLDAMARGF
jgi:hypothetical protein